MNDLTVQHQDIINYNSDQLKLIKDMYAKDATNNELELLMYMSNKYGLDILTKQIWCVKFGTKAAQIYAGRDGFLEVGHRSGLFNGMETKTVKVMEPFTVKYFSWDNGKKVWEDFKCDYQFVSTCTVYRKDMDHPIEVEVYEEEYSTGQSLWTSKRRTMTAKVAESQCLRKAFSISGLYSPEEIYQSSEVIHDTSKIIETDKDIENPIIDKTKIDTIKEIAKRKGIIQHSICEAYGIKEFKEMKFNEWKDATDKLNLRPDKIIKNDLDGII